MGPGPSLRPPAADPKLISLGKAPLEIAVVQHSAVVLWRVQVEILTHRAACNFHTMGRGATGEAG